MPSPIVRFFAGEGTDHRGRRMADILAWSDTRLEGVHDYIQWLFPLPEPSGFNRDAPLLTQADIAAFKASPALRQAVAGGLARMRRFYGLQGDTARQAQWLTPGNHNMLRLSRILRCLHLLGLDDDAARLLQDLEALYQAGGAAAIGPVTLGYWRRAVA